MLLVLLTEKLELAYKHPRNNKLCERIRSPLQYGSNQMDASSDEDA